MVSSGFSETSCLTLENLGFHRYPSHARMWMAPIRTGLSEKKISDYEGAMDDWHHFTNETKTCYGVDMSVLTKPFSEEQKKYYLQVSSLFIYLLTFICEKLTTRFSLSLSLSLCVLYHMVLHNCEMWIKLYLMVYVN